jgi:hypothetical protein
MLRTFSAVLQATPPVLREASAMLQPARALLGTT